MNGPRRRFAKPVRRKPHEGSKAYEARSASMRNFPLPALMVDAKQDIVLWKTRKFIVVTRKNPHLPKEEGCHLVIYSVRELKNAWESPKVCGEAFELAAKAAKILVDEKIVDWANLQYNGNWGLLKGATPVFHVHIYGRKKSGKTWGQPADLPKFPGTFSNKSVSKKDIAKLIARFKEEL